MWLDALTSLQNLASKMGIPLKDGNNSSALPGHAFSWHWTLLYHYGDNIILAKVHKLRCALRSINTRKMLFTGTEKYYWTFKFCMGRCCPKAFLCRLIDRTTGLQKTHHVKSFHIGSSCWPSSTQCVYSKLQWNSHISWKCEANFSIYTCLHRQQ